MIAKEDFVESKTLEEANRRLHNHAVEVNAEDRRRRWEKLTPHQRASILASGETFR